MKNNSKKILLFASLAIGGIPVFGQDEVASTATKAASSPFYENFLANGMLLFSGAVILGAVFAIFHLLNVVIKMQQLKIYQENGLTEYLAAVEAPKVPLWKRLYKKWTNVVPVEKEKDIMLDHNYDGIRELDNSLPPWWVAMFYVTIIIGVVYFSYYHVFQYGPNQAEEYAIEMETAAEEVKAYLAKQANQIDETNAEALTDETQLAMGKAIYDANCLVCHGALGEGGVGPNMTDEYWLHGGGVKNIFKTIKYGVPEKGMIAWKSQLRPSEIHQVASFILTLEGTNPPNGKAPEGEVYQAENTQEVSDTTNSEMIGMIENN